MYNAEIITALISYINENALLPEPLTLSTVGEDGGTGSEILPAEERKFLCGVSEIRQKLRIFIRSSSQRSALDAAFSAAHCLNAVRPFDGAERVTVTEPPSLYGRGNLGVTYTLTAAVDYRGEEE